MKISSIFAAVLSFEAAFAFPHNALQPSYGKALVRRTGSDRSSSHGSGGHRSSSGEPRRRPAPGYEDTGYRHDKSGGRLTREEAREIERSAPRYSSGEKVRVKGPNERRRDDQTEVREDRPPGQPPNYDVHLAADAGPHLGHHQFRVDTFGRKKVEGSRYKPDDSSGGAAKRRSKIGALPKASELKGEGRPGKVVLDESEAREWRGPINQDEVGDVPYTAFYADQHSSVHRDSPYQHKAAELARKNDGTMSYSGDRNAPRQAGRPARAPYTDRNKDWGKPVDARKPKDHSVLPKSRHSSSSDSDRSRSPRNSKRSADDDSGFEWRDWVIVETDPAGSAGSASTSDNAATKRDAVGQAAHQQAGAESDHPQTNTAEDFKQDYMKYLSTYEIIRNNATDLILPFVQEMVNGSNSSLIWDAGWEIMSLADPALNIMGPMMNGMHNFDSSEADLVAQGTPEATMNTVYLLHGVMWAMYKETWDNAYDALNASGMIDELDTLNAYLRTNETFAQDINQDMSGTNDLNDFFLNGPYSELADIDDDMLDNSTTLSGNETTGSSDSNSTLIDDSASPAVGSATNLPIDTTMPHTAGQATPTAVDTTAAGEDETDTSPSPSPTVSSETPTGTAT
ncbi:MAG: hypothetical protein Q9202_001354 [Teloschistes flavicans]